MAGIGFELKKMFRKTGIFNTLRGVAYSTLTTVGPMIMVILTIIIIQILFDYNALPYGERDLLSAGILYVFVFSLLVTSPVSAVLSRYVADRIFEKNDDAILSSYYVGLALCAVAGAAIAVPFCLWGVYRGGIDPWFLFLLYLMFALLCMVFFTMSYISILKEYRRIASAFFVGMLIVFAITFVLTQWVGMSLSYAMLYAFNAGYWFIGFRLYTLLRLFVPHHSTGYRYAFSYFGKHKMLFAANLLYTLGLYLHNFVFWNSSLQVVVSDTFFIAPAYDLASCLGMFTNISFMVAFVVKIETNFYDKYHTYCHMLVGGNKNDINNAKKQMFLTLTEDLTRVIKLQALFTSCFILFSYILFPAIGMGGMVSAIYPTLSVSYITVFVSYAFVVMLYYFNDETFAALSTLAFAAGVLGGALFARTLVPELYGLGLFIGSLCGFTVSILRLSYLYNHLDEHIFCHGEIVKTVLKKPKKPGGTHELHA